MSTPQGEQPGFETDVNELPDDAGPEDTLEDSDALEAAQEEAAEERKEGGYQ